MGWKETKNVFDIPLDELRIHSVQRELTPAHAVRIGEDHDPRAEGVLTAVTYGGVPFLIDGIHRLSEKKRLRHQHASVQIIGSELSDSEVRDIWGKLNNTRAAQKYEVYMIDLKHEAPWAVAIDTQMREHGLTFGRTPSGVSYTAIAEAADMGVLTEVLDAVQAWEADGQTVKSKTIMGLSRLVASGAFEDIDWRKFARTVSLDETLREVNEDSPPEIRKALAREAIRFA